MMIICTNTALFWINPVLQSHSEEISFLSEILFDVVRTLLIDLTYLVVYYFG